MAALILAGCEPNFNEREPKARAGAKARGGTGDEPNFNEREPTARAGAKARGGSGDEPNFNNPEPKASAEAKARACGGVEPNKKRAKKSHIAKKADGDAVSATATRVARKLELGVAPAGFIKCGPRGPHDVCLICHDHLGEDTVYASTCVPKGDRNIGASCYIHKACVDTQVSFRQGRHYRVSPLRTQPVHPVFRCGRETGRVVPASDCACLQ